ncbi:MAG: hypothetical protein ACXWQO_03830 [Bdellovibrionota bacterium]
MKPLVLLLLLLITLPVEANAGSKIADACGRLTARDPELTRNCVNHAELFEVDSEYIGAVVQFNPSVEIRMKALKSGANVETLNLCKSLGWSTDNTLSCLRSYPTPEIIKSCKKLSPKQEEQLRCIREGRESTQVDACTTQSDLVSERFTCLDLNVPTLATINCNNLHSTFTARMACMKKEVLAREEEFQRDQTAMRERVKAIKLDPTYGDSSLVSGAPTHRGDRIPAATIKK